MSVSPNPAFHLAVRREKAERGEEGLALARAGLADDAKALARFDIDRDLPHCPDVTFGDPETNRQILNRQNGGHSGGRP
jgi:hypothetical protein